jgi:hypothetical protein
VLAVRLQQYARRAYRRVTARLVRRALDDPMNAKTMAFRVWASAVVSFASLAGIAATASLPMAACGGGGAGGTGPAKLPAGSRAEKMDHEECSESGHRVEALDTNGDGKVDIRRVFDKGDHELCRIADLNHDGKPDLYEYFDVNGAPRRREYCYDDTGVVNAVEYYDGGKLVRREYDTTGQHRIDTWDWFDPNAALDPKTGRPKHPVRRERDMTGDGQIDQWWAWNGDKVTIAVDRSGDGKPDPGSAITLGADESPGAGGGADAPKPPPSSRPTAADGGAAASAPPASTATQPATAASTSALPSASASTRDGGKS